MHQAGTCDRHHATIMHCAVVVRALGWSHPLVRMQGALFLTCPISSYCIVFACVMPVANRSALCESCRSTDVPACLFKFAPWQALWWSSRLQHNVITYTRGVDAYPPPPPSQHHPTSSITRRGIDMQLLQASQPELIVAKKTPTTWYTWCWHGASCSRIVRHSCRRGT